MTITINHSVFTVYNPKKFKPSISNLARYAGRTIYDCYEKPSSAKVSIYNEWLNWANKANIYYFGVSSYNGFKFSLQGLYEDENGNLYILSITRENKIATIVKTEEN